MTISPLLFALLGCSAVLGASKTYLAMDGYTGNPNDDVGMYFTTLKPSPTVQSVVPLLPHSWSDTGYFGGCVDAKEGHIYFMNFSIYNGNGTVHVTDIKTKKQISHSKVFEIEAMIQDTRCDTVWNELILPTVNGKNFTVWSVTLDGTVKKRFSKTFPGFLGEYDADAPSYDSKTHSLVIHLESTYAHNYHRKLVYVNLETGKSIIKDIPGPIWAPAVFSSNPPVIYFLNTTMKARVLKNGKLDKSLRGAPVFLSRWDLNEKAAKRVSNETFIIGTLDPYYDTGAFSPDGTLDTWGLTAGGAGALLRFDLKSGKGSSVALPKVWFEKLLPWSYAQWVEVDL